MKRFHVHVSVEDLDRNIAFYTRLFGAAPKVTKPDYAKWMLEDPRVNFAISARSGRTGIEHLGLQVDSADELEQVRQAVLAAGADVTPEKGANCCYAKSDKYWAVDPQGVPWEAFHTLIEARHYGTDTGATIAAAPATQTARCCAA